MPNGALSKQERRGRPLCHRGHGRPGFRPASPPRRATRETRGIGFSCCRKSIGVVTSLCLLHGPVIGSARHVISATATYRRTRLQLASACPHGGMRRTRPQMRSWGHRALGGCAHEGYSGRVVLALQFRDPADPLRIAGRATGKFGSRLTFVRKITSQQRDLRRRVVRVDRAQVPMRQLIVRHDADALGRALIISPGLAFQSDRRMRRRPPPPGGWSCWTRCSASRNCSTKSTG